MGKSASYLLKLAPLLWWALPAKKLSQVTPENDRLAAQDWIPDNDCQEREEWVYCPLELSEPLPHEGDEDNFQPGGVAQAPEDKFFAKLQEEQARNFFKLCNLANQVTPKKRRSKDQ
ncbi:hypothetical protein DSO57_1010462 [Entomophthora muscae]|uniref:Uncharacterized protein n=1 Tax=Entomophthora muscae TaxID=34485 RepID=A0ACC2TUC2_9FUNG|nr:hypothetical protein DSO57_1010462 [Entomophthora muscae]